MPTIVNTQLPSGIKLRVYQQITDSTTAPIVESRMLPTAEVVLGPPDAPGVVVDQAFWDTWKSQNYDSPLLLNGVVMQTS